MPENQYKGIGMMKFAATVCFILFGIVAFMKPGDEWNPVNLIFGAVIGLLFTFLCAVLFRLFAGAFNADTRRQYGKVFVKWVVWRGMLFLVPFAVMSALAAFFLRWSSAGLFLSAGLMSAATAIVMEISRFHERPRIKNSIILPMAASVLSIGWMLSIGWLQTVSTYLGAVTGVLLGK